jgi:hypothetical protein
MSTFAPHPTGAPAGLRSRRALQIHLGAFALGNALAWLLWGALSVSGPWYLWPLLPLLGWAIVLTLHAVVVSRS